MKWINIFKEKTKDQINSESEKILFDEEHELGARITLVENQKSDKKLKIQYKISDDYCGIEGFYYFSDKNMIEPRIEKLKTEIEKFLLIIPKGNERNYENLSKAQAEIYNFDINILNEC